MTTKRHLMESDPNYVRKAFDAALNEFIRRDLTLLAIGAHEQAICHRIAVYLEPWFRTYSIDCEYNRLDVATKKGSDDRGFRPDIIVHHRTNKTGNLFVVDAKCTTNGTEEDHLMKMIQDNDFRYSIGLFLLFHTKRTPLLRNRSTRISGYWRDAHKDKHDPFTIDLPLSDDLLAKVTTRPLDRP